MAGLFCVCDSQALASTEPSDYEIQMMTVWVPQVPILGPGRVRIYTVEGLIRRLDRGPLVGKHRQHL